MPNGGAIYTQAPDPYIGLKQMFANYAQQQQWQKALSGLGLPQDTLAALGQISDPQMQMGMLNYLGKQQPTMLEQAQAEYYQAGAEQRRMPPTLLPTQQIAGRKLAMINRLEAIPKEQRTKQQQAMLEKMLAGQPMVQIDFGKPAAAAERTAIAETRASIDALNNLKTLYDSPRTETGPLKGRVAPIAGLVGMTTDEQEAFMAATSAFKNAIIKEITGAQMSEVEAKRIMKQIPDITDPSARWEAKWKQSKKNLEFLQKRRLEILRQSGIRVPEALEQPIPVTDPNRIDAIGNKFGF